MLLDASEIQEQFKRGHAAHRAGELEEAARIYEGLLAASPEHAPSLHALGTIFLRRGHVERAEALIRQALDIDPLATGFNNSLGNVFVSRGLYDRAREAYERELQLRPDFAIAHNQLGSLAQLQSRPDLAIAHFRNALKYAPQFAVAANNLGRALKDEGQLELAADAFRQALSMDEKFAEAQANLGHVMCQLGEYGAAREHFRCALEIEQRLGLAWRGLAQLDINEGRTADAITGLETAIDIDAGDASALALLGSVFFSEGMLARSAKTYARALDLRPEDPDLLCDAAAVNRAAGDLTLARDRYKAALTQRATHQTALAGLGALMAQAGDAKGAAARLAPSVNSGRAGPELLSTYADILGQLGRRREGISLLETALQKRQPTAIASKLHFALAALLDGEGSYDLAFFHCRRAHDGWSSQFDPAAFDQLIDQIITHSNGLNAALPISDWHAPAPVFVVGLPRSGVRVLARVMEHHTRVFELGPSASVENSALRLWQEADSKWPSLPEGLTAQDASRAAHRALSGRLPADCATPMFLDANWRNFFYLGAIVRLFPNAKIIECTRDVRDIARSCYFQNPAQGRSLPFANELTHIAAYVNGYRRLMAHWHASEGLNMHRVSYEQLVMNAQTECRRISDFLGVAHADSDYGLHADDGLSWHLDAKALRRFRHYRSHLDAFTDALDGPPEN